MTLVALFFSQYGKPILLIGLIAGALVYREIMVHELNDARGQVTQLTAETASLRANNQALGAMIDRQNAAVAELRAKAEAAAAAMTASEASAQQAATSAQGKAEQQAQSLMTSAIDANTGCEGAVRWGNAQAAVLSSW